MLAVGRNLFELKLFGSGDVWGIILVYWMSYESSYVCECLFLPLLYLREIFTCPCWLVRVKIIVLIILSFLYRDHFYYGI